ncbi:unnamed protein product [Schistosoma mattheei]|uniref:Uncharacterized protein n=1 Tax=Schistosoma mattheei TaxID=31246 RepID=A0A183PVI9_9TREM|nr:unnamed protein product [Schistosoma mattheei]
MTFDRTIKAEEDHNGTECLKEIGCIASSSVITSLKVELDDTGRVLQGPQFPQDYCSSSSSSSSSSSGSVNYANIKGDSMIPLLAEVHSNRRNAYGTIESPDKLQLVISGNESTGKTRIIECINWNTDIHCVSR